MLKISDVKIKLNETDPKGVVSSMINVPKRDINDFKMVRKAVDARRKNHVHFNCAFEFSTKKEELILKRYKKLKLSVVKPYHYPLLKPTNQTIMIVGSGPAGLFCAYNMARSGQKVILVERGKKADQRQKDIDEFHRTGHFNPKSNVQFGEGGAGTFSDGKLTSGIKDFRKRFVLETFVKYGAHEDLLYLAKPHIGTDVLIDVVKNMREYLIEQGSQVLFETQLVDIEIKNQEINSVTLIHDNQKEEIKVDQLILAIGHSARDTYEMLYQKGLEMTPKSFAVGMRIEHPQSLINENQYGSYASSSYLQAADYKLAVQTKDKRGVYSFCMCPGGYVINASSEEGQVVCNGMSHYHRDNEYANSAILVTVTPEDFKDDSVLGGMHFQRELEKKAFELGGSDYSLPIQQVIDYINDDFSLQEIPCSVKRHRLANLNQLFPQKLNDNIKEGLLLMNKKIEGFIDQGHLIGVESRSSAPVRFYRKKDFQSNIKGIYPIGEGAGYAGGIMSSAVDGLKCSEECLRGNDI